MNVAKYCLYILAPLAIYPLPGCSDDDQPLIPSECRDADDALRCQAEQLAEVLAGLDAAQAGNIAAYRPWTQPFLLIDGDDPARFVAFNLACPPAWACEPFPDGDGPDSIPAVMGRADGDYAVAALGGYEFIFREGDDHPDRNIAQLLAANLDVDLLYAAHAPLKVTEIAEPAFLTTFAESDVLYLLTHLHEGFHLFVQFASLQNPAQSTWQMALEDSLPREDVAACRDLSVPEVREEVRRMDDVYHALSIEETRARALSMLATQWLEAREARYRAVPSVGDTDCRRLDDEWERAEGMADYAAERALLDLGVIDFSTLRWLYRGLYFDNGSPSIVLDYGFYAAGALAGHLLDKLADSAAWREQVAGNAQGNEGSVTSILARTIGFTP